MPVLVNCTVCNCEFGVKPGLLEKGMGKCCSYKCSAVSRKTGEYKVCQICSNKFYLSRSEIRDGKGKYCSDKCRYEDTSEERTCSNCGTNFRRTKKQLKQGCGKYCSQQCSNQGRQRKVEKVCINCGNGFSVQRFKARSSKYCSKKCQHPLFKKLIYAIKPKTGSYRNCIKCEKSFYTLPSRKDKKFCSKQCMKSKLTLCSNAVCNKMYYVQPSVLKKGYGKYCSRECRSAHLTTKLKVKCQTPNCEKILNLTKYEFDHGIKYCSKECKPSKKTGQILQCKNCGREFYVNPRHAPFRKNCSMKCYKTGELTPLHKKIRHLSIYFNWRKAVFERDNFTCRECGKKSKNLEAHHVKYFKTIKSQYNIQTIDDAIACDELWDINNGLTLCGRCHKQTENHGARKRNKEVATIPNPGVIPITEIKKSKNILAAYRIPQVNI